MGGIYISHMRDEAKGVLDSVRETISIAEWGGLPAQITHHKIIGKENWCRSVDTLRLVDDARARGVDETIDQYPYTASSTGIGTPALLPAWALESGDPRNVVVARCEWASYSVSFGTSSGNPGNTCPSSGLESTNDRLCLYIRSSDGAG